MNAVKRDININTNNEIADRISYGDIKIDLGQQYIILLSATDREYFEYKKLNTIMLVDSNKTEVIDTKSQTIVSTSDDDEKIVKNKLDEENGIFLTIKKFLNKTAANNETLFITTKSKAFRKNNSDSIPTLVVENTLVLSAGDEYEVAY